MPTSPPLVSSVKEYTANVREAVNSTLNSTTASSSQKKLNKLVENSKNTRHTPRHYQSLLWRLSMYLAWQGVHHAKRKIISKSLTVLLRGVMKWAMTYALSKCIGTGSTAAVIDLVWKTVVIQIKFLVQKLDSTTLKLPTVLLKLLRRDTFYLSASEMARATAWIAKN